MRLPLITAVVASTIGLGFHLLWLAGPLIGPLYDRISGQRAIDTPEGIDAALRSLPRMPFAELKQRPLAIRLGLTDPKLYGDKLFLQVDWFDRYKYLVGTARVAAFLPDFRFRILGRRFATPFLEKRQWLLVDRDLLHRFSQLLRVLEKSGYDSKALLVKSGFRPPATNEIGGARNSFHLQGQAMDIKVGDINRDDKENGDDLAIVYQILDAKIIGANGGIGKYHQHNQLHFDTRGYRARW